MNIRSFWSLFSYVWQHPLNRSGRFHAICRVARWQLGSRLLPGAVAVPFVGEAKLMLERGMTGATGNWYCGLHEPEEMSFVLHVLRAQDVFVDVGANIGSYTILATAGAGARTVAIEPIPETFKRLKRNVRINEIDHKIDCLQVGVSSEPGKLAFTSDMDTVNHVVAPGETAASLEVDVLTLDTIIPFCNATVIKIDVEGHEYAVLRGASSVLQSPTLLAVVMETNGSGSRYGIDDQQLFRCMADHGFSPYRYHPLTRELSPCSHGGANSIFVRDLDAVKERVCNARRFRIVNGLI